LRRGEAVGEVLFVGKHEHGTTPQLVVVHHSEQLSLGLFDPIGVVGVDHEDDGVCAVVIVMPELADLFLSSHVPISEGDVFVFDRLYIEADLNWESRERKGERWREGGREEGRKEMR
jgi:hypothetical protein